MSIIETEAVHAAIRIEKQRHEKAMNLLLGMCPVSECGECAKLECPFEDELHFHHDGCPSCAQLVT